MRLQDRFKDINLEAFHEVSMLYERLERMEKEMLQKERQAGRQEGHQEGRQAMSVCLQAISVRLLEKRFGALALETKQRLEQASAEELQSVIDRILNDEVEDISVF
jgi:flagellar biosynthesis/type III secretory pathway protein FliH